MPIITCADCGNQVSDHATACPHCGRPIAPTQIEATAKRWKAIELVGAALLAIGLLIQVARIEIGPNAVAITFSAVGLLTAIVARGLAWWYHG